MAPIVSTAFDTRERPRRLPITLSEHARRASWAPIGAADVSRCERTAPSREDQDAWALRSHQLAAKAQDEGWFDDEIVGIEVPQGRKKDPLQVTADEGVRRDTSLERLAKLRPVFRDGGSVTAGNASQINDGACALLVMSASRAQKLGLQPLARVVSWGHAGVHPGVMGIGPVPASQLALRKVRRARARRRCSATLPTHAGLVSLRPSRAW